MFAAQGRSLGISRLVLEESVEISINYKPFFLDIHLGREFAEKTGADGATGSCKFTLIASYEKYILSAHL